VYSVLNGVIILSLARFIVLSPIWIALCLIGLVLTLGLNVVRTHNINIRFYFIVLVYLGGVLLLVLYICSSLPNPLVNTNYKILSLRLVAACFTPNFLKPLALPGRSELSYLLGAVRKSQISVLLALAGVLLLIL